MLLSLVSCLLHHVFCLTSPVSHLLSHVSCITTSVSHLLSHVPCLPLSPVLQIHAVSAEDLIDNNLRREFASLIPNTKYQCCGAELFFLASGSRYLFFGSGSRYKFSARAPPIKAWLRPAPAKNSTDFDTKHLKNLNFNKFKLQWPRFCPKNGKNCRKKRFTQSQKMYLVLYLSLGIVN